MGRGRKKVVAGEARKGREGGGGRVLDVVYRGQQFPLPKRAWGEFAEVASSRFQQARAQLGGTASSGDGDGGSDANNGGSGDHERGDTAQGLAVPEAVDDLLRIGGPPVDVQLSQPIQQLAASNVTDALKETQRFLNQLQYNHTGMQFFPVKKTLPLTRLMELGKLICRTCLPIKCLEAVVVALYLLLPYDGLDRLPISFKSRFRGHTYQHIVLGIHVKGRFGALGLSRREHLMYKPCRYDSLASLIREYEKRYTEVGHTLVRVRLGRPIPASRHSTQMIPWRHLIFVMRNLDDVVLRSACERFMRRLRSGTVESDVVVVRAGRRRGSGRDTGAGLDPTEHADSDGDDSDDDSGDEDANSVGGAGKDDDDDDDEEGEGEGEGSVDGKPGQKQRRKKKESGDTTSPILFDMRV